MQSYPNKANVPTELREELFSLHKRMIAMHLASSKSCLDNIRHPYKSPESPTLDIDRSVAR